MDIKLANNYCYECNKYVDVKIEENIMMFDEIYEVNYLGKKALCSICGEEVDVEELDFENSRIASIAYETRV